MRANAMGTGRAAAVNAFAGSAALQCRSCGVAANEDAPLEWRAPGKDDQASRNQLAMSQVLVSQPLSSQVSLLLTAVTIGRATTGITT